MGDSPFIKVEATQFTEVGFHGKDVETIITELAGSTVRKYRNNVNEISENLAEEMGYLIDIFILDFLIGEDNLDDEGREYKFNNIRKGLYDDF